MELSVALFVVMLVGAFLVGLVLGIVLAARRHRRRVAAANPAEKVAELKAELDSAHRAGRQAAQRQQQLQQDLEAARHRATAADAELATIRESVRDLEVRTQAAERVAEEHRARFRDIVGLESENATLRAIALRVRELEAQLDPTQASAGTATDPAAPETVIDLRDDVRADPS